MSDLSQYEKRVLIYAGIDEAGYGPIFGPMVVARSVFCVESWEGSGLLPSLWSLMQAGVCRRVTDSRDRVAVNDSKLLYSSAAGVRHLERGVLGFLRTLGEAPSDLEELLRLLALDEFSAGTDHPCYRRENVPLALPVGADIQRLQRTEKRLRRLGERTGVRLLELGAGVALEDRFNRLLEQSGNKARCAWTFVAGHLSTIWERYGERAPQVVIDRQGGRIYYLELLAELFPGARLCIHRESPALSCYEITEGERSMRVTVQVASEKEHLPAAFASMTAKYLRELLMMRFQGFWRRHAPEVRPTCGYYGDGRRFLREIEPLLPELGLTRERVVRRL